MASKTKVSEWDSVASNNILINGINIDENCPPSAVNNAIREMMAQIKDWQSGSSGDDWTSSGVLNVTGILKLDGSAGTDGQVLSSKGSSATPVWTTLGSMSSQNSNNVNITGGSVNVTGSLKLDNSVGSSGQVLTSLGGATPVWKTLSNMSNQSSNAVNITGGTITGLSNLTATNATLGNTNTTGFVKFDGSTGSSGQVLTSQGGATPKWKTLGTMSAQNNTSVNIDGGTITGTTVNGNVVGSNSTGKKTISTGNPSGGSNGDIWYKI